MPPLMGVAGLKLLMTADSVGGVWTYALDLARGLSGHGVRTTLAILGPMPSVEQRAVAGTIEGLACVETGYPLDWSAPTPHAVIAAGQGIAELSDAIGADLVHLNSAALAAAATPRARMVAVAHSCVATWWDALRTGPLPPDLAWRFGLVRQGYAAASGLLAPSAAVAAATAATYGLSHPPVVVHNGRQRRTSVEEAQDEVLEAEPVAFTAGRLWDEAKNLATLDRAAARISVPVLAAGATLGPNGAEITLPHIRLLGIMGESDLVGHFRRRPIFVSAARYEPFGLAVLEAAQAGCPLLLADIPTFRELWDGAATFVPPDDDAAFAREIESLAADVARRRQLGRAALERSAQYGVDEMVAGTLAVYRAVLAGQAAAA